jgi:hypothetical protein
MLSTPASWSWTIASSIALTPGTAQDFGTVPVGQTSITIPVSTTFTTGATLGTPVALTEGAINLDFAITGGTCVSGAAFAANASCTVNVTFTPSASGLRRGAILLTSNTGAAVAELYVHGVGSGPQVVLLSGASFAPSSETAIGGGFRQPQGIAVDGAGNVYVADYAAKTVTKIPPNCTSASCTVTLASNLNGPSAIAVDGGGNVYVSELNPSQVREIPYGCASASCMITLGGGFYGPEGVAVDGAGNVYVADYAEGVWVLNNGNAPLNLSSISASTNFLAYNSVDPCTTSTPIAPGTICTAFVAFTPTASGPLAGTLTLTDNNLNVSAATQQIALSATGLPPAPVISGAPASGALGIADGAFIDGAGNLYIADAYNYSGVEEAHAADGYSSPVQWGGTSGSFGSPRSIAVDVNGNMFVAASYGGAEEIPAGCTDYSKCVKSLPVSSQGFMYGMGMDGVGNAYFENGGTVFKSPVADNYSTFSTVASKLPTEGLGADDLGNLYLPNYVIQGAGYAGETVNTTIQEIDFNTPPTLTFATSTTVGSTDTTDGALTATINNNGNGAMTFTAMVKEASGTSVPTGTVAFMDGSAQIGGALLDASGVGTISVNSLAVGAHSVTAVYGGDSYDTTSTSAAVSVTVATTINATTMQLSASAAQAPVGGSLTLTAPLKATLERPRNWPFGATGISLAALAFFLLPAKRRRRWMTLTLVLAASLGAFTALTGCGGGFAIPGPLSTTYTVTVTATGGSVQQSTTIQLTVK